MSGASDARAALLDDEGGRQRSDLRLILSRWAWLIVVLPLLVIAFALLPDWPGGGATPRAARGVLDLRGTDLGHRVIRLDDGWELYWRRFVAPESLAAGESAPDAFVALPDRWRRLTVDGQPLATEGYATYHLKILNDPQARPLALRLNVMRSAFQLWGNGRLLAESGKIATRIDDERAEQKLLLVDLPAGEAVIDLVLYTSNFHAGSGSVSTVRLGVADEVRSWQNRRWVALFFVAGALMLTGVYHLVFYLARPDARSALYFGLYSLLWMVSILCVETDWAVRALFPDLPADGLFRLYRFCMIAVSAVSYQFFRSLYPREFPLWIQRVFWAAAGVFMALAVLAPIGVFVAMLPAYYPFSVAKLFFSFWALFVAYRRQRDGAPIILAGQVLFGLCGINDILNDLTVIHTVLLFHFGVLIFVIAQSLALALRFSNLFAAVERLSEKLATNNRLLENEVTERIRVQHDIVALSEAERSRISRELHDGLCQQLTGARLLCSLLNRKWAGNDAKPDELAKLSAVLDNSVGQAYDLSHGLWPVEPAHGDLCQSLAALVHKHGEAGGTLALDVRHNCERCRCANASHVHSIAREAVVNATKHAHAQRIEVRLDCRQGLATTLTVSDDGVGVQPERRTHQRGGLGLRIMAYRARMVGGEFRVEARAGGGTQVVATLPCRLADDAEIGQAGG